MPSFQQFVNSCTMNKVSVLRMAALAEETYVKHIVDKISRFSTVDRFIAQNTELEKCKHRVFQPIHNKMAERGIPWQ